MYIGNAIQVGNNRFHDEGCRLYIGGIIRTVMPQSVGAVEKEIKSIFESMFFNCSFSKKLSR